MEVFLRWSGEVLALNPFLRHELNLEFFVKNPTELLTAVLDNPSLPQDVLKLALSDLPTLANTKDGGSDHLQRLLGEQISQHGAIDLLLQMNTDTDDILDCLEHDLSEYGANTASDPELSALNEKIVDTQSLQSQAFIRSTSYASLLIPDLSNQDLLKANVQKSLFALQNSITVDHFCLQQFCVLLANSASKPLSLWLLEVKTDDYTFSTRLWQMQDPVLLTKVASKYANFFRTYLHFLVTNLKNLMISPQKDLIESPACYSSDKRSVDAAENLKLRIRALAQSPRLSQPTKTYLAENDLSNVLPN